VFHELVVQHLTFIFKQNQFMYLLLKKKMSSEYLQEVANDYEKLLETDEDYNVIIYVGENENENVKEIHAHSNILRIRSHYFRAALSNEWSEKKDGKFIFRKPNITPQLFEVILR
jgi:hypothetical protein